MKQIRKRLTYANVMSSIAVFLVLGGAAFAAAQLPKNSVGKKQLKANAVTTAKIKKNAVTTAKIKNGAITGVKVNESTLETVPSATTAGTANVATSLSALEPVHLVGAAGEPGFENGSANVPPGEFGGVSFNPVGFYKDHEGIVHLQGVALVGKSSSSPVPIFTLPAGFRPASGKVIIGGGLGAFAIIGGSNTTFASTDLSGKVAGSEEEPAFLDGITFRAES